MLVLIHVNCMYYFKIRVMFKNYVNGIYQLHGVKKEDIH